MWIKDPSHLSDGRPKSRNRECPAGMENSRHGHALSRAKRPKPAVLALIVRERQKSVIPNSVFVFSGGSDPQVPLGNTQILPAADISPSMYCVETWLLLFPVKIPQFGFPRSLVSSVWVLLEDPDPSSMDPQHYFHLSNLLQQHQLGSSYRGHQSSPHTSEHTLITAEGKEAIFFTLYYCAALYITDPSAALCFASLRSIYH